MLLSSCIRFFVGLALTVPLLLPVRADELVMATDDWPPFRISNEQGLIGLDLDLIDEIAKRTGASLTIAKMPWGRALTSMQTGDVDVMTGLAYRDERAQYIAYTDTPYFKCTTAFYTIAGQAQKIKTYEDLARYQVGYVLHSAYFDRFDNDVSLDKVGVAQEQILIDMLMKRRFGVMIGTDCQVDYFIKRQGFAGKIEKAPYNPGNAVDLFLGVSKKSDWAGKLDLLNKVVKDLVDEGFVDKISEEYYGTHS
ncbi:substrate-binding periplasmic protein [Roseibium sediminicola]|uniref:Transporter substrate-binding domain-containing protein n=1 Tax=Roseibium sediminicola TaxID=2933272 RepID=A0ABT0H2B4_9HYPH|nr:transporter substrate-binding domain-containing protein [Roseibium sp. CAU 1639]MCK7615833.1 transporter substrate-binding domain-containing protein [Roseibium sp. CAU 1639]